MSRGHVDPAMDAYVRRVVPTMILYVALIIAVPFIIHGLSATGPLLWLLAALPALPLCAVFWFFGRLFTDLRDDYVRMLEVRKALIATGFALSLASIWGWLEVYGQAPHVSMYVVPVAWFAGLAIGSLVNFLIERQSRP
jgi:hypothetical protein